MRTRVIGPSVPPAPGKNAKTAPRAARAAQAQQPNDPLRSDAMVQVAILWSDTYGNRCMHVRTGTVSNFFADVRHGAAYHVA